MAEHDFWASISRTSPRYADWAMVFTDPDRVPITTPIAEQVMLPIGVHRVLFVATDLLTPGEKASLILFLAVRFHQDPQAVQDAIDADPRHSVPILDEDVSVLVLHPHRWLPEGNHG